MKKINKLVLNKAKVMTAPEMKNITGGGYWICCRGTVDNDGDGHVDPGCHNGYFYADTCNSAENANICGGWFYTCA